MTQISDDLRFRGQNVLRIEEADEVRIEFSDRDNMMRFEGVYLIITPLFQQNITAR